jgi:hypothetical protein
MPMSSTLRCWPRSRGTDGRGLRHAAFATRPLSSCGAAVTVMPQLPDSPCRGCTSAGTCPR